jgi:hypothetical protein
MAGVRSVPLLIMRLVGPLDMASVAAAIALFLIVGRLVTRLLSLPPLGNFVS